VNFSYVLAQHIAQGRIFLQKNKRKKENIMTTQTTLSRTKAPFRADHVGSFLRPESIKKARKELAEGKITKEALREIENVEITRIVDKQIALGYKGITDGEFRRSYWHFDFLENLLGFEGYLAAQGKQFHNVVTSAHSVRNIGKIAFNPEHPFFADYAFLAEAVGDRAVAKVSIPSPNQLIRLGFRNEEIYPTLEEYAADLQQAYRDTILHFYSLGNRYIQIDDTFWGDLCSDKALEIFGSQETYDELKRVATENVKNIQKALMSLLRKNCSAKPALTASFWNTTLTVLVGSNHCATTQATAKLS